MGQNHAKGSENGEFFQAGGHGEIKRSSATPGTVMKVGRGTEIEFYQSINSEQEDDSVKIPEHIMSFFPKFYGVQFHFPRYYVVMEDLTAGMSKPCVMDIKMGTQTWEPNSLNVIKRYQLETKDHATTTHSLGFRITGMRVFRKDTNDYVVHGKEDCMRLAKEDTCEAFLKNFFMDGESFRLDAINFYIKRLVILLKWFKHQHLVKLIGNSLLFVYDSDQIGRVDIRMIDFAHVQRIENGERDEGYIHGLKNLVRIFRSLRRSMKTRDSKMNSSVR